MQSRLPSRRVQYIGSRIHRGGLMTKSGTYARFVATGDGLYSCSVLLDEESAILLVKVEPIGGRQAVISLAIEEDNANG